MTKTWNLCLINLDKLLRNRNWVFYRPKRKLSKEENLKDQVHNWNSMLIMILKLIWNKIWLSNHSKIVYLKMVNQRGDKVYFKKWWELIQINLKSPQLTSRKSKSFREETLDNWKLMVPLKMNTMLFRDITSSRGNYSCSRKKIKDP